LGVVRKVGRPTNIEFRVLYSQGYLFNAIPDINHNANPANINHNSKVTLTLLTVIVKYWTMRRSRVHAHVLALRCIV